jgi:hypothetical protein
MRVTSAEMQRAVLNRGWTIWEWKKKYTVEAPIDAITKESAL